MHGLGGIGGLNGIAVGADNGAGIQPGIHLHNAHAGFGITGSNGTLNGGSTAPARQQRGVDVQAASARNGEDFGGQQQAVGGHHHHIGLLCGQECGSFGVAQGGGLRQRQTQRLGGLFYRAGLQLHAAAFGAVGLGEHQHHVKTGSGNGV